jgi:predicted DNA-binding transcriptional regulator AlpA
MLAGKVLLYVIAAEANWGDDDTFPKSSVIWGNASGSSAWSSSAIAAW